MKRRPKAWVLLFLLLTVFLASCGGKADAPVETTAAQTTSGSLMTTKATSTNATTEATTAKPESLYVNGEVTPFEELTDGYWPEQAEAENCIIDRDDVISGHELWEQFVKLTSDGTPAAVRVVTYYKDTLVHGTESRLPYDELICVSDIVYDGEIYRFNYVDSVEMAPRKTTYWDYLIKLEKPIEREESDVETIVWYVLTRNDQFSWSEIAFGQFPDGSRADCTLAFAYNIYMNESN